jgi:hypothetical protein
MYSICNVYIVRPKVYNITTVPSPDMMSQAFSRQRPEWELQKADSTPPLYIRLRTAIEARWNRVHVSDVISEFAYFFYLLVFFVKQFVSVKCLHRYLEHCSTWCWFPWVTSV